MTRCKAFQGAHHSAIIFTNGASLASRRHRSEHASGFSNNLRRGSFRGAPTGTNGTFLGETSPGFPLQCAIGASRPRLWLLSGRGRPHRRPSTARRNPGTRLLPWRYRPKLHTHGRAGDVRASREENFGRSQYEREISRILRLPRCRSFAPNTPAHGCTADTLGFPVEGLRVHKEELARVRRPPDPAPAAPSQWMPRSPETNTPSDTCSWVRTFPARP